MFTLLIDTWRSLAQILHWNSKEDFTDQIAAVCVCVCVCVCMSVCLCLCLKCDVVTCINVDQRMLNATTTQKKPAAQDTELGEHSDALR